MIFYRATNGDCLKLLQILETYEKASGQAINTRKSGILFSSNTSNEDKDNVMSILRFNRSLEQENYLGLPLLMEGVKLRNLGT